MGNRLTPLDMNTPAIELKVGLFTWRWQELLRGLFGDVAAVSSLPAIIHRFAFAAQPSLGADDENYLAFETTYGHLLRWTGAVWEFAPGDPGNGYFEDYAIAPQAAGWILCDGTLTDYLTVGGALLTVTAITPPNLTGVYRKGAAAYAAGIVAASAPGLAGATAAEAAHTHHLSAIQSTTEATSVAAPQYQAYEGTGAQLLHTHYTTGDTDAAGGHSHGPGSLAVDATGDPAHVNVQVYFRR